MQNKGWDQSNLTDLILRSPTIEKNTTSILFRNLNLWLLGIFTVTSLASKQTEFDIFPLTKRELWLPEFHTSFSTHFGISNNGLNIQSESWSEGSVQYHPVPSWWHLVLPYLSLWCNSQTMTFMWATSCAAFLLDLEKWQHSLKTNPLNCLKICLIFIECFSGPISFNSAESFIWTLFQSESIQI